ncbi:protein kinase domain-containing protein [Sorangium sp. So ce1335]|uniref:serine/threonine-protein kinase n=1 Tax=Sorangium sp. So ce1335 TaxID=3133335 RepID=UPI003F64426C
MAQAGSDAAEPASWRRIPRVGDIIGGKYRVERVLGRGGMGLVVSAHHVSLRHRVALKFLLPEGRTTPGAVERFFREAQAAAAIASEHIARVIDVGHTDEELPYFVMEYLNGIDLEALVETRGPLPIEQAVSYVIEACEALAEAHALGIVHRDLKPGNLFLASRKDGSTLIKVLDFGISKASDASVLGANAKLTASSVVLGSPRYMSPEHIRSIRTVDARSDIWALGMTLYQLLTGRLPFETESVSALFVSIVTDPPVPPRAHRPEIPVELECILLMCLEKNPARRPQTVAELVALLDPLASEPARRKAARILRRAMGGETEDALPAPGRPRAVDEDAQTLTGPHKAAPASRCVAIERPNGPTSSVPPTQASPGDAAPATARSPSAPPVRAPAASPVPAVTIAPPAPAPAAGLVPAATLAPSVPAPAAGPRPGSTTAPSAAPPADPLSETAALPGELQAAAAPHAPHERGPAGHPARGRHGRRLAPVAAALVAILGGAAALAWLGGAAAPVAPAPPAAAAAAPVAPSADAPPAPAGADPVPSFLPPSATLLPPVAAAAAASGFAAASAALAPVSSAKPTRPRATLPAGSGEAAAAGEPAAAGGEPAPARSARLREHR